MTRPDSPSADTPLPVEGYAFGRFKLLPGQRALLEGGAPVRIGSRALELLLVLVRRAGEVVSKDELLREVWPATVVDEAGLRVHIAALRKALGESHSGLRYIANIPLRGYCFVVPVQPLQLERGHERIEVPASMPAMPAMPTVPPRLTRLIGREEAVAAAMQTLLQRRCVTLVGPGGMGKTSVALVAAERCAASFADGVCFIDLAAVAEPSVVPAALATALGAQLASQDPVGSLVAWLRPRRLLVVLDNCEHVVDAAALLTERLIGGAPGVSILATSREPLRVRGEWVQRLGSLAAPPVAAELPYAEALGYAAVELFVERAMASLDGFSFGDADVSAISALCRRLDGMPLAIELVAARVGMFGLRGLVERLDDHLSLPTLGHRTALPRHQGLRATMDWSYGLLPDDEQRLLSRLSVFRERFTLEAAASVASSAPIERGQVTPLLMNLVAKSLVVAEPGEDLVSYRLLQTTRGYAAERLLAGGEQDAVRRRHASHCESLLDSVARDNETLAPVRWRERHGRRLDDLRAALDWAFGDSGEAELGVALLAHSPALWFGMSLAPEYMQRLAAVPDPLPPNCRDGALDMRIHLVIGQVALALRGATAEGEAALERALQLARRLGDGALQVRALWSLFSLHSLRGDYAQARDASAALGEAARAGHDRGAVYVHHRTMALCLHHLGDPAAALEHVQIALAPEAAALQPAQGMLFHLDHRAAALTQQARILWLLGRTGAALQAVEEAIEAAREVDHALSLTYVLSYAACPVALWCGRFDEAQRWADELQACTAAHHLYFWQSWPPLFQHVLALHRGALPVAPLELDKLHFSHIDVLPSLRPGLADAAALARVHAGSNLWSAAEILRVAAVRAAAAGEAGAREQLLGAWALAREQGAHAWALRCAISLGEQTLARHALADPAPAARADGGREEALDRLAQALEPIDAQAPTTDLAQARALCERLGAPAQRSAAGSRARQASASSR